MFHVWEGSEQSPQQTVDYVFKWHARLAILSFESKLLRAPLIPLCRRGRSPVSGQEWLLPRDTQGFLP